MYDTLPYSGADVGAMTTATVVEHCGETGEIRIRPGDAPWTDAWAAAACRDAWDVAEGDRVLIATTPQGERFVIGVMAAPRTRELRLSDGTRAVAAPDGHSLEFWSAGGQLLWERDAVTRTTRLTAADGDFEIVAPRGSLKLVAAAGVDIRGARVAVRADETAIDSPRLRGRFDHVTMAARLVESLADTVVSQARNVFDRIAELWHTRAGRTHTQVEHLARTTAAEVQVQAEHDVKVVGRKIHLG